MFKLIVAFALVAACTALSGHFFIDIGDNNVIVRNVENNQQVKFYVNNQVGLAGRNRIVNIEITGPEEYNKVLQVQDVEVLQGQYQSEFLYQIFKQYAGKVDETAFVNLLNTITKYVQKNQVNPLVLYALQTLVAQNQAILNQYGQHFGQGIYGWYGQQYSQDINGQYGQWYNQGIYGQKSYPGQYRRSYYGYQPFAGFSGSQKYTSDYYGPYSSTFSSGHYNPYYGQQLGRQNYVTGYPQEHVY